MLPDSSRLCKQSIDRADLRSLEHPSDNDFGSSQSSQQSDKKRGHTSVHDPIHVFNKPSAPPSIYVQETLNAFLDLWPHRFDYLHAPHPNPGDKPKWQTESRHPLADRLIIQGASLLGVRPGPQTSYALLDIDNGSPYHPRRDPLALQRICDALEPLGIVARVVTTSSHSQGLHIYFPLGKSFPSWQIALVVTILLENAGFKIRPGWLEVFPNRKPFSTTGKASLFNGHRLPLQQGSYLLNADLQPIASSQQSFVRQWHFAGERNDLNRKLIKQLVRQSRRKVYRVTGRANKFINDLNADINLGWTGRGQTNHLLGRITMRSFIFGHVLYAEEPLTGQSLIDDIVSTARSLPGFKDYCGHQHELEKKAREWQRSIEDSRYFPYGLKRAAKVKVEDSGPSWNERQEEDARQRIRDAIATLCQQNQLPEGITKRFKLLCVTARMSGDTLYKHRDLWHPEYLSERQQLAMATPPDPPVLCTREGNSCAGGAEFLPTRTSLLVKAGCNTPTDNAFSERATAENEESQQTGCNSLADKASEPKQGSQPPSTVERSTAPEQLALNIKWALKVESANRAAQAEANRQRYERSQQKQSKAEYRAQLEQWADSGDPILVAEAEKQLRRLAATANRTRGSG